MSCHRDTIPQWGGRVSDPVCTPHGPSSVAGLTGELGKAGAIPFMPTAVGMVFSKLGLASHGSCQVV